MLLKLSIITKIIFILPATSLLINKTTLIHSYLERKLLNFAVIADCFIKSDTVKLAQLLCLYNDRFLITSSERFFELPLQSWNFHHAIILNGDCPNNDQFLQKVGNVNLFNVRVHWLIITKNFEKAFTNLINVELNINADIHIVEISRQIYPIYDVYNPAFIRGGTLKSSIIGNFSETFGYVIDTKTNKYFTRRNMTGVTFKTQVVLPVPFEGTLLDYASSDKHRDVNTFNRFQSRLLFYCRDYYNFSFDLALSKSWGYMKPDGTFDGMVGDLARKKIDFGLSPLFFRSDRLMYIDYGRLTWTLRAAFIFRNVKASASFNIFLKPLSTTIWLTVFSFFVCAIIILKLITNVEEKDKNEFDTNWSRLILFVIGSFCQQGSDVPCTWYCARITILFILILSLVIYQFYSASLVSTLLMKPSTQIKTTLDLLNSQLEVGCEDILYNRDFFKFTNDTIIKQLYEKKILGKFNSSNFLSPEEGLKKTAAGKYAFHVEVATAYPIIEHTFSDKAICDLRELQMMKTQPMHLNFQKHTNLKDMLDVCVHRMAENGMWRRELVHWHPRKPSCIHSAKTLTITVGLDDLYPSFSIIIIGIIGSLSFLLLEIYLKRKELRQSKKKVKRIKNKRIYLSPLYAKYPFVN